MGSLCIDGLVDILPALKNGIFSLPISLVYAESLQGMKGKMATPDEWLVPVYDRIHR